MGLLLVVPCDDDAAAARSYVKIFGFRRLKNTSINALLKIELLASLPRFDVLVAFGSANNDPNSSTTYVNIHF